jgi:hypothetical protein
LLGLVPADVNQLPQLFNLRISSLDPPVVFLSWAEPILLHSMASGGTLRRVAF